MEPNGLNKKRIISLKVECLAQQTGMGPSVGHLRSRMGVNRGSAWEHSSTALAGTAATAAGMQLLTGWTAAKQNTPDKAFTVHTVMSLIQSFTTRAALHWVDDVTAENPQCWFISMKNCYWVCSSQQIWKYLANINGLFRLRYPAPDQIWTALWGCQLGDLLTVWLLQTDM